MSRQHLQISSLFVLSSTTISSFQKHKQGTPELRHHIRYLHSCVLSWMDIPDLLQDSPGSSRKCSN
eukprot:scaffold5987_cov203-Amphora_coffeaeformis.AAC.8